jgi:hypothetical protein
VFSKKGHVSRLKLAQTPPAVVGTAQERAAL